MSEFLQFLINGVTTGTIYVLVGVGVTLVYGLIRLVNLAHGELLTLGALTCVAVAGSTKSYPLGVAAAGVVGAIAGLLMERGGFRFTRATPISGFILSLGLAFVIQGGFFLVWGDSPITIPPPIPGIVEVFGVRIAIQKLIVIGAAAAIVIGLLAFLKGTPSGRAVRAYSDDSVATELMGVKIDRLVVLVFVLGSAIAGLGGGLLAGVQAVDRTLGSVFALKAFLVAIVGGLGNVAGALAAGLLLGVSESLVAGYVSGGAGQLAGLVVVIAILMIRPSGLVRGGAGAHL